MQKDQELILQYLEGSDKAFEILLTRHKQKIYTSIYLFVKDHELADDIFQDVFIKIIDTLRKGKYNHEGQPATALPQGHPGTSAAPVAAGTMVADSAVAAVEDGKDIAWVYANKDSLAGQPVSLRGKVVKYNANILGTNWLHIQDGSGSAADGSNDLVVTSAAEAAVGDTVVITGNIALEKDFGAGYSYPVLVEDASLTAE